MRKIIHMEHITHSALKAAAVFKQRLAESILGQEQLIEGILIACIAGGHVLLEGAPGLAKTLTVRSFAELSALSFKRIQFTPDLLPADLTGTLIFEPATHRFLVRKGPLFAHIILADEINRAPAKVQSALLEAMAEGQITIGENSYRLPQPFFVLATQNPLEQEGTYPLPEAELDRFLFKLFVPYPKMADEIAIMLKSSGITSSARQTVQDSEPVFSIEMLQTLQTASANVRCSDALNEYIVSIVSATRPSAEKQAAVHRGTYLSYISAGASPRASIGIYQCAKISAFLGGRDYVIPDDIKKIVYPVLRHRIKLSYEASAENITADDIITKLLETIPQP
ncbi:MAG: AAA family ATPase [Treponema sp.]